MNAQPTSSYDVFVSYATEDQDWVERELLPQLESKGLTVCLPNRDFAIGLPTLTNIERAVENSRHTLLVITPAWLNSDWNEFELLLAGSTDPAARQRRLIPLLLKSCPLPPRLAMLTLANFTDTVRSAEEMKRLLVALGSRAQIFISYKRHAEPDEPLAQRLRTVLEQAGHHVFIDQKLTVGVEWALEVNRQIEASDFLIVLLSAASMQSEMVAAEVGHAAQHHSRTGKAQLIPVRVAVIDPLPYQLSHILDRLQYAVWERPEDDESLFRQLLDAVRKLGALQSPTEPTTVAPTVQLSGPAPFADPRFVQGLREPGGAISARSTFYIERTEDELLQRELAKVYGSTITIRAARQTGKSSLLLRGVEQAKTQGYKIAFIDLQPLEDSYLTNLNSFLRYVAAMIIRRLHLDPAEVDKAWQGGLGAADKLTYLMEDYILPEANTNIVLALDEADRLLQTPFQDNFFALLRSWHNSRAIDERWDKLDIVLVISTEPHLLISDVNQSPFNVGQKIRLQDFQAPQVQMLNERYRSPLTETEIPLLFDLLGGHPYLTQKALYTLVNHQLEWARLRQTAATEESPFGDHLRRYLWLLRDQPDLRDALKRVIHQGECPDEVTYYRLLQAGLIKGNNRTACTFRCKLYEEYLGQKLC